MRINFLGTNGWFDQSSGSTPSILIRTEKENVILDAGFGIAKAKELIDRNKPVFLFLSHFHLDHIVGLHALPYLNLAELVIVGQKGAEKILTSILNHPFTAPAKEYGLKLKFIEVAPGKHSDPLSFECLRLNHADASLGFALEIDNRKIVYLSDTSVCKNGTSLAQGADVLIHESASQQENVKWGHASPQGVAKMAREAKVKRLYLTHFTPNVFLGAKGRKEAEKRARKFFPNAVAASDGLEVEIS